MKVLGIRDISKTAFVLRLERGKLEFVPGQCANIGIPRMAVNREYSIYSGIKDKYVEFLIKEVQGGVVSASLRKLKVGDKVSVDGAYGLFNINDEKKKYLFVATGTGIAPFHSIVKSYPKLDYKMLHGIRTKDEEYDKKDYKNYISCVSGERQRVTDYLKKNPIRTDTVCYLCGNSNMINDVYDILREKGISGSNIHSESFF